MLGNPPWTALSGSWAPDSRLEFTGRIPVQKKRWPGQAGAPASEGLGDETVQAGPGLWEHEVEDYHVQTSFRDEKETQNAFVSPKQELEATLGCVSKCCTRVSWIPSWREGLAGLVGHAEPFRVRGLPGLWNEKRGRGGSSGGLSQAAERR